MAEISEEGDEQGDGVKKESEENVGQVEEEKTDEVEVPPVKNEVPNHVCWYTLV